ncbi:MAG: winged helix DNA-binding domain-containing protein [Lachnospiraceae bacterium]|nr:winged helix DNA-binding domain-containing protein [Lachnospiraceae bacterium]
MEPLSVEQIRNFRLRSHHLDAACTKANIQEIVGACGMQNSPPGAWETALFNRIPTCTLSDMDCLLYKEKSLLQAWSFRGAPVIFPAEERDVFLSALKAEDGEPWIYTQGIQLALDFLQMTYDEVFDRLRQVLPRLEQYTLISKTTLDQTLAEWMLPLIPTDKQERWNAPSMYGSPDKQTVGGAAVSFLLRPASFYGLIVFGERNGISPSFTAYSNWTGHPFHETDTAEDNGIRTLVRKFLHCYGPATLDSFVTWLGCSKQQGRRMWDTIAEEMEPVTVLGKKSWLLSSDKESILNPVPLKKELLLLGGHDPFLDQRDRLILQPDKTRHKQIWKLVSNPGAIVYRGEIIGVWTSRKKSRGIEINVDLWKELSGNEQKKLQELAEGYAEFRQTALLSLIL